MNPVLEATRTARAKTQAKRDKLQTDLDALLVAPAADKRTLNDDEGVTFTALSEKIAERDATLTKQDRELRGLEDAEARADKAAAATVTTVKVGDSVIRSEPMTYDKYAGNGYFRDLATLSAVTMEPGLARHADEARARMIQHAKEVDVEARTNPRLAEKLREIRATPQSLQEQRVAPNTSYGTGGEFVPPLWLVSSYIPLVRPGRVFANRVNNQTLPPGIDVINIPKITVGSQAGIQTANAAAVTSVDIQTSTVSAPVNTIAGQEDISMQLLEQSPLAMDGVIFDDLSRDYDQRLDLQVVAGTGTNGQHRGVLNVAGATSNASILNSNYITCASVVFHDASTAGTQFRSIVNAKNQIETLRYMPATAIWVAPRRANSWEYSAVDTQGRPLYVAYAPFNALGIDNPNIVQGVAGALSGLPVVKDNNMVQTMNGTVTTGGTADAICVLKEDDIYLWEGSMRMRALPEILSGTLQVRFQLYCYSALLPNRFPPSISIITGNTGLAAPTF